MNIQHIFPPILADRLAFYMSTLFKKKSQLDIFHFYFLFFFYFFFNPKTCYCNLRTLDILKKKSHI